MSTKAASEALVAVRRSVSRSVADLGSGDIAQVACSGGADSMALAGATAWVAAREGLECAVVIVDHALQQDSGAVAARTAQACRSLGISRVRILPVTVGRSGGPEAAAREARYAALESAAVEDDAAAILLGHTLEDQAETVLLRLARGSGARSLSAMSERSGPWRRPFLGLPRAAVRAAAIEILEPIGATPWDDPHNEDPAFARVRVRRLLDQLTEAIGPGAVLGLARSAELLRDDADALDALAADALQAVVVTEVDGPSADCAQLAGLQRALRTRVIRQMCLMSGCPADALTIEHVRTVEALVTDWRGQGDTSLPGGVVAGRAYGRLCLRPPASQRSSSGSV